MPTPPTLVACYASSMVQTNAITSSSISLQAGDIVTVIVIGAGGVTGNSWPTTGCTTTFANGGITSLQNHTAASNCQAAAWTFTVSTTASGTVTTTQTSGQSDYNVLRVFAHRAGVAPTVARSTQGASSSRTVNYTASQADSAICWGVGDWSASAVQAVTPTSTTHSLGTPGPSSMPASGSVATQYTDNTAVLDDQTLTSAVAYGIGGTGTGPFTVIVVEVQGTGGAVASTPRPPKLVTRNAVMRASVI